MKSSIVTTTILLGIAAAVPSTTGWRNDVIEPHVPKIAKRGLDREEAAKQATAECIRQLNEGETTSFHKCVFDALTMLGARDLESRQLAKTGDLLARLEKCKNKVSSEDPTEIAKCLVEDRLAGLQPRQIAQPGALTMQIEDCRSQVNSGAATDLASCVLDTLGPEDSGMERRQEADDGSPSSPFAAAVKECGKKVQTGDVTGLNQCVRDSIGIERRQNDAEEAFRNAVKKCKLRLSFGQITDLDGCVLDTLGIARR